MARATGTWVHPVRGSPSAGKAWDALPDDFTDSVDDEVGDACDATEDAVGDGWDTVKGRF